MLEDCWNDGSLKLWLASFGEMFFDEEVNRQISEFVREKMRERLRERHGNGQNVPEQTSAAARKRSLVSSNEKTIPFSPTSVPR